MRLIPPQAARALFDRLALVAPIRCLDVGAMALEGDDPWSLLAAEGCTEVVGFEPNPEECRRLEQLGRPNHAALPFAVGNGSTLPLHITNTGMTSSLLEPDLATMGLFRNLAELCEVVSTPQVTTQRLDNVPEARNADFLKLDIQGGELMALRHATETLGSVVVVQTEVEFLELYRNQPLFADVDSLLRSQGFVFHHFTHLSGRPYALASGPTPVQPGPTQTLWGDAVYVRDPRRCDSLGSSQLRALAFILIAFYRVDDLALQLLEQLDRRDSSRLAPAVAELLGSLSTSPAPSQAQRRVALPLANGLQLVVPDNIELITPYVVAERGAWFEDELPMISRLLQPGQSALDIGANYGLYTLAIAQAVGPDGLVHAFEPASQTAELLRATLKLNGFESRVRLHQVALSNQAGSGRLALHSQAELNSLLTLADHDQGFASSSEAVAIDCLDHLFAAERSDGPMVAFIKMDAEGQESAIIQGGRRFLEQHSPLVMFEVKAEKDLHLHLIDEFQELGFNVFQLVPGLQLLAPLGSPQDLDSYILNLFACRLDRQLDMQQRQLLVAERVAQADPLPSQLADGSLADAIGHPYAQLLTGQWQQSSAGVDANDLSRALRAFLASQLSERSASSRLADLETSYRLLEALVQRQASQPRLLSLARVALALGRRSTAVSTLGRLVQEIKASGKVDASEPFLLPCGRYEALQPRPQEIGHFVYASALEALNDSASYSSIYSPRPSLERLTLIEQLGFADQRVRTTIKLIRRRLDVISASSQA